MCCRPLHVLWTRLWTVIQDVGRQPDQPNRIYSEPRCHEGNYGLPGLLIGARAEEQAYEEGRGPTRLHGASPVAPRRRGATRWRCAN